MPQKSTNPTAGDRGARQDTSASWNASCVNSQTGGQKQDRPIFRLTLVPGPHVANPEYALRGALKVLWRRFGLRYVSLRGGAAMTEHFETGIKKGRGMAQRSLDLIEAMYAMAEAAQPITGRGVGYKLFTAGLIPSMSTNGNAARLSPAQGGARAGHHPVGVDR